MSDIDHSGFSAPGTAGSSGTSSGPMVASPPPSKVPKIVRQQIALPAAPIPQVHGQSDPFQIIQASATITQVAED